MRIMVNGDMREVSAARLAEALAELDFAGAVIATAVNGDFVPAAIRGEILLREGDRVEIVAPMQGG